MHISAQPLPQGCTHLRLHPADGVEYTAHTIIKPISATECELVGLNYTGVTMAMVKLALAECAKLGFSYCYIQRKKANGSMLSKFDLSKYNCKQ